MGVEKHHPLGLTRGQAACLIAMGAPLVLPETQTYPEQALIFQPVCDQPDVCLHGVLPQAASDRFHCAKHTGNSIRFKTCLGLSVFSTEIGRAHV